MNRLLYILLLTVSLYGLTPSESCPNNNPPYVSSVFGLDINVGCLNPSYYLEETTYTCNSNNISKKVQYYDNSQYCSSGRKYVKHDIYTYSSVASCPNGQVPDVDGVCVESSNPCNENELYNSDTGVCTPLPTSPLECDYPQVLNDDGTACVDCSSTEISFMGQCWPKCARDQITLADGTCKSLYDGLPAYGQYPEDAYPTSNTPTSPADGSEDTANESYNSSGSSTSGNSAHAQADCIADTVIETSLGYTRIIGWDEVKQKCKVLAYTCDSGKVYNRNTKSCDVPPDNADLGNEDCSGGDWGKRSTHDFCNKCDGVVYPPYQMPSWTAEYGLQCDKKYLEYNCVTDYRVKNFLEVSCGDVIPDNENDLDLDNINESDIKDQNRSNLPEIDPTEANKAVVEGLTRIEDTLNKHLTLIFDKSSSIDSKLSNTNSKIDITNSKLDITNSKLNSINNNISNTNSKLDDIKNVLDDDSVSINSSLASGVIGVDDTSIDGGIFDNLADNLSDMTNSVTSIQTQFTATKDMLTGDQPTVTIPTGSCSNEHLTKFGSYLAPYSSIFSLVVYVGMMILIFKMIFSYMARGE